MILHYLKIAVRQLLKYKTQNVISIVGLSVALLCFTLCLFVTYYAFDVNKCFEQKDRIVQFYITDNDSAFNNGPHVMMFFDTADEVKKVNPSGLQCLTRIVDTDSYHYQVETAQGKMMPYQLLGFETDSNFISVFTPEILAGNWNQAVSTPNSMVLTESTAKRMFGSANDAVGRKLYRIQRPFYMMPDQWPEGGVYYTVQAVMEDIPTNNTIAYGVHLDYFTLNDEFGYRNVTKEWMHASTSCFLFGLIDEQTDVLDFCNEFEKQGCIQSMSVGDFSIHVAQMGKNTFYDRNIKGYLIWIPLVAGILVLLVGCLNFFHLLIGSLLTRIREYSISRVNGATGWNLVVQLTLQSGMMIAISGVLAFVMAELLSPHLHFDVYYMNLSIGGTELYLQLASYLFCLLFLSFLICSIVVWYVCRIPVQDGVFGGSRKYGRKRVRNVMLCIQLVVAWIFVCLAVVYFQQGQKVEAKILSFISPDDKERIIGLSLTDRFTDETEKNVIVDRVKSIPDIEDVLVGQNMLQVTSTSLSSEKKITQNSTLRVNLFRFASNATTFTGMKILKGTDWQKPGDILVDEKLAGLLAEKFGTEVVGMKLYYWGDVEYTVAGICEEIVLRSDQPMAGYYIEFPEEGLDNEYCYIKCRKGCVDDVRESIDKILCEFYPESFKPECSTLAEALRVRESDVFFVRDVAMFMSVVILLICLLGVYSAITLDTEFRQKEMAIRKVNGASMKDIAILFARLYIVLLTVSFVIALPVVLKAVDHVSSLYYIFIETGFTFYATVFIAMLLIVALTVGWKIWRISRVNPAEVIKRE
ncbi:MAG: ABC transporter permease [Bacteroidaceae bacterium]|nr:ABC transporter permease [Bacteroidaceae bacterium]